MLAPVFCFSSILGIIFGHIAMARIRNSGGRLDGKGFATAGLVIGYVWLALSFIIGILWVCFYAMMIPVFLDVIEREHQRHALPKVVEQVEKTTIDQARPTEPPVLEKEKNLLIEPPVMKNALEEQNGLPTENLPPENSELSPDLGKEKPSGETLIPDDEPPPKVDNPKILNRTT